MGKIRQRKIAGIPAYLRTVTSQFDRSAIFAAYRRRLVDRYGQGISLAGMNAIRRELLVDAIFERENEIASRTGGQPDHPRVVAMRAARDRIYDDLAWNEEPSDA